MGFFHRIVNLLTDKERGPRSGEAEQAAQRSRLAPFLPWRAYDPDTHEYLNADDTRGYILDCTPLPFAGTKALDSLTSLLGHDFPDGTVVQFSLYTDDNIKPLLDEYVDLKTRGGDWCKEAARRYADHLYAGSKQGGMDAFDGTPTRIFRLMVSIKAPAKPGLSRETMAMVVETLAQSGLAPRYMEPPKLLELMRRIFNEDLPEAAAANYNDTTSISEQLRMADSDFSVDLEQGVLKIGNHYCGCLTPMTPPNGVDSLKMNRLIGGYRGREDDGTQITQRFLWTTSVFFNVNKSDISRKANILTAQRAGGSIAKAIGIRVKEVDWVLDDLEKRPYVNVITSMWIMGESEDDLRQGIARARAQWEAQDFLMQREKHIAEAMFIASLPMGLYTEGKNIPTLNRDLQMSTAAAARFLPVQGDVSSFNKPVLVYPGRKGGLCTLDLFDANANNYNFLIVAESGAGKSFQSNFIVNNYYAAGAKIRIVDIGYSYQKQAEICGGRFVDIGEQAKGLVMNPFTGVLPDSEGGPDEEDVAGNIGMTANIVLSMIFSSTGNAEVTELHHSLAKDACRYALKVDGGFKGIDHVAEYLRTYPEHAPDHATMERAKQLAHEMALNIRDFTTKGCYGKMFNGKSTLNIESDDFVVLELEQLLNDPELFNVMVISVINMMTQSVYLSDRKTPTIILFDEAWKYFGISPIISAAIVEAYRRVRKYLGSIGTITQSPLDLAKFGTAGDVIANNSYYHFMLQSSDYAEATRRGLIELVGMELELVKTVRNNAPRFSECMVKSPSSTGVIRFAPDDYTYWMNTSSGKDYARYHEVLALVGGEATKALEVLAPRRHKPVLAAAA